MTTLPNPKELQRTAQDAESAKERERLSGEKKRVEEQRQLHEVFMARDIGPEASDVVTAAVRRAAEQGKTEAQIFVFPASWTTDRGRRINNGEPDWPDSLEGFAKRAFDYYKKELHPLGYRAEARVLTFAEGIPGDVGVILKW